MKICVFTSTRADFGLLLPLLRKIQNEGEHQLQIFATGTHFAEEHGSTYKEIIEAGFEAHYKIPLSMTESALGHLTIFSECVVAFGHSLRADPPDVAVVLGDRYEALAFALAANSLGITLAHLHGGEVTQGALDDGYRHCITKLSYLHFTVSETCQKRVIRMGEAPDRVFNTGALAMDAIQQTALMSLDELRVSLNTSFSSDYVLMTYHPETMSPTADRVQVSALLKALQKVIDQKNSSVIITRSNADQGSTWIHQQMEEFVSKNGDKVRYFSSLGSRRYLSFVRGAQALIGNSSSGIYEAPCFGVPTINVGDRQKGRDRAISILDVNGGEDFENHLEKAIDSAFQLKVSLAGKNVSPFGFGHTAQNIYEILNARKFERFQKKEFYEELGKI